MDGSGIPVRQGMPLPFSSVRGTAGRRLCVQRRPPPWAAPAAAASNTWRAQVIRFCRAPGSRRINGMTTPYWPLAGLRLATPRLELRWPTPADLDALASLAAGGVHDPGVQPFANAWTEASPADRAQSTLQYHWQQWGAWKPADWSLNLVVVRDGEVVASQGMRGRDYAVLREVDRVLTGEGQLLVLMNQCEIGARRVAGRLPQARLRRRRHRALFRQRPPGRATQAAPGPGRLGGPPGHSGTDQRTGCLPVLLWLYAVTGAGRQVLAEPSRGSSPEPSPPA